MNEQAESGLSRNTKISIGLALALVVLVTPVGAAVVMVRSTAAELEEVSEQLAGLRSELAEVKTALAVQIRGQQDVDALEDQLASHTHTKCIADGARLSQRVFGLEAQLRETRDRLRELERRAPK